MNPKVHNDVPRLPTRGATIPDGGGANDVFPDNTLFISRTVASEGGYPSTTPFFILSLFFLLFNLFVDLYPDKHLLLFPRHRPKELRQTIIFHYKYVNIPRRRWPVFPDGVVTNCPDEGAHDEVATAPHAPTPCSADPFESVRRGRCKPRPFQNGRPYQDVTDDRHTTDTSVAVQKRKPLLIILSC